jgi:small subunit ribosomal protein S5
LLRSAPPGTGIIAGGPIRSVFEALGVKDVVAKSLGTTNPHNMVRATFNALEQLEDIKKIAERRGKKVTDLYFKKKANEKQKNKQ